MANYATLAASATRMLTSYGEGCTLRHSSGGSVDPVTGFPSGYVDTDTACHVVFDNGSLQYIKRMDGQFIAGKHLVGYCSVEVAPELGDLVIRSDGTKLTVRVIEPIDPAGSPLLYVLMLER